MKKSRFTNEQIAFALKQVESGTSVEEVCRKIGVSQQTFYRWKKKFAGMGVEELRRLNHGVGSRPRAVSQALNTTRSALSFKS